MIRKLSVVIVILLPMVDAKCFPCSTERYPMNKEKCFLEEWFFTYPKFLTKTRTSFLDVILKFSCPFNANRYPRYELINNTQNVIILDSEYCGGKLLATTPNLKYGTPATLSTVVKFSEDKESYLRPYPDWRTNRNKCKGFTSIFTVKTDCFNRLWAIDCGVIYAFTEKQKRVCQPKLIIIDLATDRIIATFLIPDNMLQGDTVLTTIEIDVISGGCQEKVYAYIADALGFQIIVFSLYENKFYNFKNKLFYPDPSAAIQIINGYKFEIMVGVSFVVLSNDRTRLYWLSLTSTKIFYTYTKDLQNASKSGDLLLTDENFAYLKGEKCSQSLGVSVSDRDVLFFGLMGQNSLACVSPKYNQFKPMNVEKLIRDDTKLTYITGMKRYGDNLFLTNSPLYLLYVNAKMNPKAASTYIRKASISCLVKGTKCDC